MGFRGVAWLAQGLPVRLIPEQALISPMGSDVVYLGSLHYFPGITAQPAQRMLGKEPCPRLLPSVSVSALSGILAGSPAIRVDRLYCPTLCHLDTWLDGTEPALAHSFEPSR